MHRLNRVYPYERQQEQNFLPESRKSKDWFTGTQAILTEGSQCQCLFYYET